MYDEILLHLEGARVKAWERCGCTMKCSRIKRREKKIHTRPASTEPITNYQSSVDGGNDTNIKSRESKWKGELEGDIEDYTEGRENNTIGTEI